VGERDITGNTKILSLKIVVMFKVKKLQFLWCKRGNLGELILNDRKYVEFLINYSFYVLNVEFERYYFFQILIIKK
jgi:hypothetical protein